MRLVVISDIHSNVEGLKKALECAKRDPFDELIVLGDLLTYGPDAAEVVDTIAAAARTTPLSLICGNHDCMYFELNDGDSPLFERLPAWAKETVEHACQNVDLLRFRDDLPWITQREIDGFVFAHANPYGHTDWRYVSTEDDHHLAAQALEADGYIGGVFGHTHRPAVYARRVLSRPCRSGTLTFDIGDKVRGVEAVILNPGSVGQPRSRPPDLSLLRISLDPPRSEAEFEFIPGGGDSYIRRCRAAGFSEATVARLARFFGVG